MLNKITLIIPTHNRHLYLRRILDYYKDTDLKIIVADSTPEPFALKDRYNIDYYHFPNITVSVKLKIVLQKIKTPYVFLCADDDFIIPSAILKCINFLEENNDYYSVQGRYISFGKKRGILNFFSNSSFHKFVNYDVNGDTPEKRIRQLMTLNYHTFYSIHRIESLKKIFEVIGEFNGDLNHSLIPILQALISVINGKHRVLPFLYSVREKHYDQHSSKIEKIYTIVDNPKMKDHYEFFIETLTNHLSEKYAYEIEYSRKCVLDAIDCILKYSRFNQNKYSRKDKKIINYLNNKKRNISFIIKNKNPRIYKKISSSTLYQRLENPSLKNYKEIVKIRKYLLKYPIFEFIT